MDSTKVGVILPIHEYNEEVRKLVERAVKSVPDEYFLLVVVQSLGRVHLSLRPIKEFSHVSGELLQ